MPREANPFPPSMDALSKYGAGLLADHISEFWTARGFPGVRAERYQISDFEAWGVRSNLVAGLPPRRKGRVAL